MTVYKELTPPPKPISLALGYFDGVHKAHTEIIKNAVNCRKNGLAPAVLTFSENPIKALRGVDVPFLTTVEQKINILEKLGAEYIYVIDFKDIMGISKEAFVRDIVAGTLKAKEVFCGYNYHFGSGASGNSFMLEKLCAEQKIKVTCSGAVLYDGRPISSTRIRNCLVEGKLEKANEMLGRYYSFKAEVMEGNHIGSKLGTPTFNQYFPKNMLLPKYGVYSSLIMYEGKLQHGVTNIGVKPTVGSVRPLSETWMPGVKTGDLYGKVFSVYLLRFLREEKKFENLDALKKAINEDAIHSRESFEYTDINMVI